MIDLFRLLLIYSSQVFEVVFVHLVNNSALFLASCCCSFMLHVLLHGQFDLYLLSFLSTGSNLNSSKISSLLMWSKRVHPEVFVKNLISSDANRFIFF